FIVTLATQLIIYGVILLLGSSLNNLSVIYKMNNATAQSYYNFVSSGFYLGDVLVEWYNIMAIVLLVAMWFIWNKTKFGKAMFAVGCNPEAANVSGINVSRTILLTFVLAGACYGVGGFQYNPINGGAQLSTGTGGELDPITAAVIGGVSFTGGIGKVSGVLLGSLLLKVIDSCLLALGVSTAYINIVKGSIILVAVALDMKKYIVKK
ncbi:MAG: beta-methylgalactoside transporter, partial [Bacilli bacterium]